MAGLAAVTVASYVVKLPEAPSLAFDNVGVIQCSACKEWTRLQQSSSDTLEHAG